MIDRHRIQDAVFTLARESRVLKNGHCDAASAHVEDAMLLLKELTDIQRIETAPKDGTQILLVVRGRFSQKYERALAQWSVKMGRWVGDALTISDYVVIGYFALPPLPEVEEWQTSTGNSLSGE